MSRTQPALSHSIKKLEEELGAPLFARNQPDVSLTEAGKALVEHARQMVRARDEAMRELTALRHMKCGALTIAAHESAAVYLLPAVLRTYLARFPEIRVRIHESRLSDIPARVLDREVQVGFVKDDPGFRDLVCEEVYVDKMILVASPHHRLAMQRTVAVSELEDEPMVLHHLCAATQQSVLRAFEQHHARCRVVAELWNFENIKSFVLHDVGVAVVPQITVLRELRERRLVQLRTPALETARRTSMIYRDSGYLADAARELIALVRTFNWSAGTPDSTAVA